MKEKPDKLLDVFFSTLKASVRERNGTKNSEMNV